MRDSPSAAVGFPTFASSVRELPAILASGRENHRSLQENSPMDSKIFISYSHEDRKYCNELADALAAVPSIRERIWVDQRGIDFGDQFHPEIQRALANSEIAILLVSNPFLNSVYITQHELPFALRQAERKALKLGILYVSSVAKDALRVTVTIDGSERSVDLTETLGVNSPDKPLDLLKKQGDRNVLYASAAEWVARQLRSAPPPTLHTSGPRHELAIFVEARRDHWQHQFFPGPQASAIKPQLDCPRPDTVLGYDLDGDMLFQLLFGSEPEKFRQLFALAFATDAAVEPTYAPLRLRLITDAEQLHVLPWGKISYQGRPLVEVGWTVEFHNRKEAGFPEYSRHLCYFPGRLLLAGSAESHRAAHFDDLRRFFQRHWPNNPEPALAADADALRAALRVGSTRLVYYYGPASRDGLLLQDRADGECMPWSELANCLQQSRSVSLLFLNLVNETGDEALAQGPLLLDSVKGAVLFQCNPRASAHPAAKAGLAWLDAVFSRRMDPVVAMHQHGCGHISAWTRYSGWQTLAPARLQHPDLVNLLLDRHRQRAALAGAKEDFYIYARRSIHHVVALGTPGCRTRDFPSMIKQHLVGSRREREVYYYQAVELTPGITNLQAVDDLVRRRFRLNPQQTLLDALLDREALAGTAFCFLVLGWQAGKLTGDAASLLRAVADWCHKRLGAEIAANDWPAKVRVISIVALEAEGTQEWVETVDQLIEEYDVEPGFHFAELDPLGAVLRRDLRNYFSNEAICGCDDRYREKFPDLLLGGRKEMPFDEAVNSIRRGEPDNWGNLFDELNDLSQTGAWPPPHYDPKFWSRRDAR